jgi:hypothetical protein
VITSGITSGAVTMPASSSRPRNRPSRARAMPAMVPSAVATVAETAAICRLRSAASTTCRLPHSATYHLVEKPPQTVASRDALNENTIIEAIGP